MSFKRLKKKAEGSQIKVTRWTGYLVEWKERGRSMDCVCENLRELDERIRYIQKIRLREED
jgi:hypothetical protein